MRGKKPSAGDEDICRAGVWVSLSTLSLAWRGLVTLLFLSFHNSTHQACLCVSARLNRHGN